MPIVKRAQVIGESKLSDMVSFIYSNDHSKEVIGISYVNDQ